MGPNTTSFTAGIFSFLSPFLLPLVPAYLSVLSGFSAEEIKKGEKDVSLRQILSRAFLFIVGFSAVFIAMGAAASSLGILLLKHKIILLKIFGAATVILGLHTANIWNIKFLNYEKKLHIGTESGSALGAVLTGFAFALGWSPCIGPVLGGILAMAAVSGTAMKGVLLLSAYSAGIAVPLIAAAMLTAKFLDLASRFKKSMRYIELISGLILIIIGLLLFFDKLMFIE